MMIATQAHAPAKAVTTDPTFVDKRARALYARATKAFGQSMPLDFNVSGAQGSFRIRIDAKHARQDADAYTLSYSDGFAMLKSPSRSGKAKAPPLGIVNLGADYKLAVDPTIRAWSIGHDPIAQMSSKEMKARSMGKVVIGGTPCELLELKSKGVRLSFTLRSSDALPVRIDSEILDSKGHAVGSTQRVFTYFSLKKPIAASEFVLH